MSDRTTITRLTRQLAATRQKLKEAQEELKYRRKAMRPTPAELRRWKHDDEVRAATRVENLAFSHWVKRARTNAAKLDKVTALADDLRGNKHERAVATAMANKLRGDLEDDFPVSGKMQDRNGS